MKVSSTSLVVLLTTSSSSLTTTYGFQTPSLSSRRTFFIPSSSSSTTLLKISNRGEEFEYLLGEGTSSSIQLQNAFEQQQQQQQQSAKIQNMIRLPDTTAAATATLTSSITYEDAMGTTATSSTTEEDEDMFGDGSTTTTTTTNDIESNSIGDGEAVDQQQQQQQQQAITDPRLAELIRTQEKRTAMKSQPVSRPPMKTQVQNFLKGKDFGEIFFTVLVPIIGGYYLTKEAYSRVSTQVGVKQEEVLEDYANEMIFHDGDFDEMKLAHNDYVKKLAFMGPKRADAMIKKYLEFYAKKKTVSPQAIRYVVIMNIFYDI